MNANKFAVGDRVAVYSNLSRRLGKVIFVGERSHELDIELDIGFTTTVMPQQCRRLKKKLTQYVWALHDPEYDCFVSKIYQTEAAAKAAMCGPGSIARPVKLKVVK